MTVKGGTAKGLTHVGRKSLSSIGNELFRYDYRFGMTTQIDGGSNLDILALSDLSPNSLDLSSTVLPGTRSPHLVADGITSNGASSELQYRGSNLQLLKCLHDGTAHFVYFVARLNNPTNVSNVLNAFTTNNTGKAGAAFSPDIAGTNARVAQGFQNNAGGSAGLQFTTAGSVTEDTTFRLYTFTWYQNGGTNNSRITIAATSYLASRNLTLGTDNPSRFFAFNFPASTAEIATYKTLGAYNLSGKSIAQIDAFVTEFITVFKQDSEYSSLTTF